MIQVIPKMEALTSGLSVKRGSGWRIRVNPRRPDGPQQFYGAIYSISLLLGGQVKSEIWFKLRTRRQQAPTDA